MKILTNIRFTTIAGIAQALSSFINFNENAKTRMRIVGVHMHTGSDNAPVVPVQNGRFSVISKAINVPSIVDVVQHADSTAAVAEQYREVIQTYAEAIKQERPDVILINGTYYLPWCLLQASRQYSIPVLLHYHGSITKETEHWREQKPRQLFGRMEQQFDQEKIFYVFPSNLMKEVVETEIFGHRVARHSILPNPVPLHFFANKPAGRRKRIGVVGRWTRVKNPRFIGRLARYNAKQGSKFSLNIVSDLRPHSKPRKVLSGLATFRRPMSSEKLSKFYASLGVVVSPSHFESYGNVANEALASGVPALVNSQMGVAETFRDLGLSEWVIDFRSVRSVYEKIKEVSGQPVSQHVRAHLQERYNPANIHGQLVSIIKSV